MIAQIPPRLAMRRAGGLFLAASAFVLATPSFVEPQASAMALAELSPELDQSIATMSTGSIEQESVKTGLEADLAKLRNADIPLMAGSQQYLAAYSPVPRGSAQYGTALKCLTQAIYYEAANEPELGQRAVAQVVLNRLRHPAYPDTVCGVVYQGVYKPVCQFSFTCDGALMRAPIRSKWARAENIARRALGGEQVAEVGTATHYHADYVVPRWAYTLGKVNKLGTHIFYRFPGSPGTSRSFYRRWAGREVLPSIDFGRFAAQADAAAALGVQVQDFVPGTTVTRDVKDRHAAADVGGRLDTTTTWRLTIPDPVQASAGYKAALEQQGQTTPGTATVPELSKETMQ